MMNSLNVYVDEFLLAPLKQIC